MDPREYVASLLRSKAPSALAMVQLLCPSAVFNKAVDMAEKDSGISRATIAGTTCFLVKGGGRYIVIPKAFCSCHYYTQQVIRNRVAWTCKHDLAVQLRISVLGIDSVPVAADGSAEVQKYFSRSH